MRYTALLLRVFFQFDLDAPGIGHDGMKVGKAIQRWLKPAMHTKRGLAFVVVTNETAGQLVERVRPALDSISSIENYWCHTAPRDVVGKHGSIDPLTKFVHDAWDEVGKRNEPKHVRKAKRFQPFSERTVKEGESGAVDQVFAKFRRRWKPVKRPQGREG